MPRGQIPSDDEEARQAEVEAADEGADWPTYSTTPPGDSEPGQPNHDARWAGIRAWWLSLPEAERPNSPGWWLDPGVMARATAQFPGAAAEAAPNPNALTPEQLDKIRQQMQEHTQTFRLLDLPPSEERQFQEDFRRSPWARAFRDTFGEAPDPNDPTYDYRAAWKMGIPFPDPGQHWPDRAPDGGQWFKSPYHPTAWKEYYQAVTGEDPDAVGVDQERFERMLGISLADREANPDADSTPTPKSPPGVPSISSEQEPNRQVIPLAEFLRQGSPTEQGTADALRNLGHSVTHRTGIAPNAAHIFDRVAP